MPKSKSKPVDIIQCFRLSHHCIAQYFAMGLEKWEIQRRTGFTLKRLTLLEGDPTFQDLIAYYANMAAEARQEVIDQYLELQESNALVAQTMISEKLDDAMDSGVLPSYAQLLAITSARDKRTAAKDGRPNVTVNIGLALDAAKERAGRAKEVTVIDNLPSLPPPHPRLTDTGLRPEVNNRHLVTGPSRESDLKKLRR